MPKLSRPSRRPSDSNGESDDFADTRAGGFDFRSLLEKPRNEERIERAPGLERLAFDADTMPRGARRQRGTDDVPVFVGLQSLLR